MSRLDFPTVVVSVLLTLVLASPVVYTIRQAMPPRVGVVDLQALVAEEEQRIAAAATSQGGVFSDTQRASQQKASAEFGLRLSRAVEQLGTDCRCILVNKAAMLGGVALDHTDAIRSLVKGSK